MQKRICDCWLYIGGCFCELNTMKDEGKRTNTAKEQGKKSGGNNVSDLRTADKPKGSSHGNTRDREEDGWIPKSPRSVKGRFTNRFFEGDD